MGMSFFAMPLAQTWFSKIEFPATNTKIFSKLDQVSVISCQGGPPIAQSSERFKTAHRGFNLSATAYGAVRRFVTALYGALC